MRGRRTLLLIIILIAGNIFFGVQYARTRGELRGIQNDLKNYTTNEKVLKFTEFFIREVLNTQKEVDFNTRFNLEKDVRELDDKEILAQWERFVNSQEQDEAQRNVKKLLELLVQKIKPVSAPAETSPAQ